MEPLATPDDPGVVTDHQALGLVDFVLLPHANQIRQRCWRLDEANGPAGSRFEFSPTTEHSQSLAQQSTSSTPRDTLAHLQEPLRTIRKMPNGTRLRECPRRSPQNAPSGC